MKNFHVEKMKLSTIINPTREDGGIDFRFTGLARQIVDRAGNDCANDLASLYQYTNTAELRYEKAGLTLVTSFFQVEMEPWERRTFLKRLRECLQEIGFKPSKVSKLITAGEFMANELRDAEMIASEWCDSGDEKAQIKNDNLAYLNSYGVSGLYQLARMNFTGLCKAREGYKDAEMKPLPVRELEKLQSKYPADDKGRAQKKKVCEYNLDEEKTGDLVRKFVQMAQLVDWSGVQCDPESINLLRSIKPDFIALLILLIKEMYANHTRY